MQGQEETESLLVLFLADQDVDGLQTVLLLFGTLVGLEDSFVYLHYQRRVLFTYCIEDSLSFFRGAFHSREHHAAQQSHLSRLGQVKDVSQALGMHLVTQQELDVNHQDAFQGLSLQGVLVMVH